MGDSLPIDLEVDLDEVETDDEPEPTVVAGRRARMLGKYRLCFELASGGMATVYLACAEGAAGFERLVAIKRIHPHLSKKPEFVEMFLDEARIASQIHHPNVCSVLEFSKVDEQYFIAMEYLHGEPLHRLIKALRRSAERREHHWVYVARIVAEACEGLHAAHELSDASGRPLNIVHRDVSPQNLYVTYDGAVRVVDFGIAMAESRLHHTKTGTVKGKFAYCSPEQLQGHRVDRRSDVWALGVVLWELLTLRRLFKRSQDSETMLAVIMEPLPRVRVVRDDIPVELETIAMRALSRNLADRYPTARDLGRALTAFLAKHDHIGMVEMAEWMETLFPEEKAKKRQLIDLARQAPMDLPRVAMESSGTTGSVAPSMTHMRSTRRRGRWVSWIGAGALLFVGAGVGAWLGSREPDVAPATPAAPALVAPERAPEAPEAVAPPADPVEEEPLEAADPVAPEPEAAEIDEAHTDDATGERPDRRARRPARRATVTPMEPTATPAEHRGTASPTGRVSVASPGGWADVFVEGNKVGTTPSTLTLPIGRHTLEIRPFGRRPGIRRIVEIRANAPARISVPLTPPDN